MDGYGISGGMGVPTMQMGMAMPMAMPMVGVMPGMMHGMMPMGMMPVGVAMVPVMQAPADPLLAGLMTGNPLLGAGNPALSANQGDLATEGAASEEEDDSNTIDPDVRKLGDQFQIEERWVKRLDEIIRKRGDSKERDILKLYEILDRARSPTGLLVVKIGEMECGRFDSKIKSDKHVERIVRKFDLDEDAKDSLIELGIRRRRTKQEDLDALEKHLQYSKRPSSVARNMISRLLDGKLEFVPNLTEAEELMRRFKLDVEAKSKLRDIVEKRVIDLDEVLQHIERILEMSKSSASATLCKIARSLIEGGKSTNLERKLASSRGRAQSSSSLSRSRSHDRGHHRKRPRSRSRSKNEISITHVQLHLFQILVTTTMNK